MSRPSYHTPSFEEIRAIENEAARLRAATLRAGLLAVLNWIAAPFSALRHA